MSSEPSNPFMRAIADRYAIEREIASGGMATVYLADDLKHGRQVALKVLKPEIASVVGAERFHREIQIAANLNHPHILPLYDSGEIDVSLVGTPKGAGDGPLLFYVMPYVRGESLRARLERETQLPVDEALRITRQVASALDYAHARQLVHRDVKPENILIHEGEAMVADFGIARALSTTDQNLTGAGIVVGTAAYMSPEQAVGDPSIDARSDVYALACVLYEMLAGEPPFTGPNAVAVMAKRLVDPVPSVRRLRPEVPPAVERAITKALARHPADRYASTISFAEALSAPDAARARARSVAVLPFLNLSADPENEYFADGITEDVITHLSKVRAIEVISRTSVMPFKKREHGLREIAARLGVGTVLDGSVRRAGDRVRIVAHLIDAEPEQHLWSETYDRQLTDIFAIQTDVALQIARSLRAELSADERSRIGREPTTNVSAYNLYLQGRHWLIRYTQEGMRKSIEYFRQAIDLDPGYALAYTSIAMAHNELAEGGASDPAESYTESRTALRTALSLDDELGEAHAALGYLRLVADFDWAGSEQEFRRALELNPGSADGHDYYGRLLNAMGRHDDALVELRRAQQLDPLAHRVDVTTTLVRAGRYEEAVQAIEPAVQLDPQNARARATLAWAYFLQGLHDRGLAELERAAMLSPGSTLFLAQLGQAYGMAGHTAKSRDVLQQLETMAAQRYVSPYHMAYVHTGLGEPDRAMDWLERAFDERAGAVYGIKGSFLFTTLRSRPRFIALLKKMNLS
jgi:eukaryotic-like serine/threonine-protein kinase